jgi:hypothetical protein
MTDVVCKFHIEGVERVPNAPPEYPGRIVTLWASYDPSLSEERRFSEATPSARMEAQITNPAALAFFTREDGTADVGKEVYMILTTEKPE